MIQQTLFETTSPQMSAMKWLNVTKAPSINTFLNHAWGVHPTLSGREYTDIEIVRAWQYSCVANYMQRMSIEPKGYVHRRHHHILPQIACPDRIAVLTEIMKSRGLDKRYGIDISIPINNRKCV